MSLWRPHGLQPTRLLCPWDSPGQDTGVGCPALLQGVFPTQGLNPLLLPLPALADGFFTTSTTWEVLSTLVLTKLFLEDKDKSENESSSVVSGSLQPHGLYGPWDSPGKNTGVGRLSLLQGIFPTQRSNPGLLHCRWILYQLSHQGRPQTTMNGLQRSSQRNNRLEIVLIMQAQVISKTNAKLMLLLQP